MPILADLACRAKNNHGVGLGYGAIAKTRVFESVRVVEAGNPFLPLRGAGRGLVMTLG